MAEFLTTSGTSHQLEQLIMNASKKLVLISPYLQLSKTFYERLKDASRKNVQIKIIYGKDALKPNEKNSLAELENLSLFFFENLHAKCYLNESKMIITSMNMYEFSEKTNREMGVLIDRNSDKEIYERAIAEVKSIIDSAENVPLKKEVRTSITKIIAKNENTKNGVKPRGYCIRCQKRIPYNPDRPYCVECFGVWVQYENPEYLENVCHRCGEYTDSSMEYPQDKKCYAIWKKEQ
jgi:phosphatidylserine/phosphatidylglycerophosphate/cardiolipin synthase-like enzyme